MALPIRRKIDFWHLVISENDLKHIKTIEGPEYRFHEMNLVENIFTDKKYVQTQLSHDQHIFAKQLNLFIESGIHHGLARFVGFSYVPCRCVYTKYYENKSLYHLLKDIRSGNSRQEWNGTTKSKCVFGIISVLTHLHDLFDDVYPNFTVRYFCPENIVFNSKFEPKIVNFEYGDEDLGKTPNAYIPPELHSNPDGERHAEDVWALGMILYEILTSKLPYEGKNEDEIKAAVMNGELPELPPQSEDTDNIIGIIQNCLEKDPDNRPEFYMIYDHLLNLKNDLFPETDRQQYENYKALIASYTTISKDGIDYIKQNNEEAGLDPQTST